MVDVDPIWNNSVIPGKKIVDIIVGGRRDCDAAVQPLVPALDYRLTEPIKVLPAVIGVECANVNCIGALEDAKG
jgi:hypothetical protein